MSKAPVIVKLGGSAITFKSKSPPTTNQEVISRIAQELVTFRGPLVIILGGGAHGHQAAHEFGFGNPSTRLSRRLAGVSAIRHNMAILAHEVETALSNAGLSCVVIPPFCTTILRNGQIDKYFIDSINLALEAGLAVVVHGDVCFDVEQGALILSGDTIVSWFAEVLKATKVLVGTDVDGIYDSDPRSNPNATLIPKITPSNIDGVLQQAGPSAAIDVTGGMNKKIAELLLIAKLGTEITIFNLLIPGRLEQLLHGAQTICTKISLL